MNNLPKHIDTFVIYCPSWVGDIVMATPLLDCFRQNFPDTRIVGLLKKGAQGIVRDGPWFDDFIDSQNKSWSGFVETVNQVRRRKADVGVLLPNSLRSALTMRLAGVRKIYGYRHNLRGAFLSGGPQPTRNHHQIVPVPMVQYYLEICRWLGLEVPQKVKPRLFISEKLLERGQSLIRKYGIRAEDLVIGLNPGASFGPSKCWPAEHFARLAERCHAEMGAKILLLSGPGEEAVAQAILTQSRSTIIDTRGDNVDLELLKPLIQRCNLLVTNDTGPRHYAVAFDVPAVVIMGSTDPRYTASNLDRTIVIRKDLDCSPCHKKICPLDHPCMTQITPDEVFTAAIKLLKECS
ncbi:MAG: lipopolysaccharide heptosyltransferase II [Planctomycetes bacterium RBG_16_55_9]|nr:MAG: lipopolysaccharide heptosyltransferase II [Planctomycetes bacterium RBG_16_55_9]